MSEARNLQELSERGTERLARLPLARDPRERQARRDDGARRRRRRHVEPDDLPEGDRRGGRVRRAAEGAARARGGPEGDLPRALRRRHQGRARAAAARVRRVGRRGRPRLVGGRSRDRVRPRAHLRGGEAAARVDRRAEPLREDPGDGCRRRRDRGLRRRRARHQRHAHLLAAAARQGDAGVRPRPRALRGERRRRVEGALRRVVLRLARRHRGRQAARRDRPPRSQGQARGREREARVPELQAHVLRPALGGARREGRAPAALPLGVDVDEEPGLPRRALRRGADRARHREHDARGDDRGVPGSRRRRRHARAGRRGGASRCSSTCARPASTTTT